MTLLKPKPFVKWAGGKRQILDKIKEYLPEEFNTYYEPFVGGGALLFDLIPEHAVINDSNKELMNVYEVLSNYELFIKMCKELNIHERKNSEEYYYKIRDLDRDIKKYEKMTNYQKAARTIYLNKACFNGLYRVNSKGFFNVPFNKKERVSTYDAENLLLIHTYLTNNDIKLMSTDFSECVKLCQENDFVYFDPPYDTLNNSFTSYTEEGFDKKQQERLANVFKELDEKGVKVMLSNHNTDFIKELYEGYNFHVIKAKRNINSKGNKRGSVEEVIITNY